MVKFEAYVTSKIGEFIWDGFTDPAGVGVNMVDVLDGAAVAGVDLTDTQKDSVLKHFENIDEWTSEDEEVRDAIDFATDHATYEQLFDWLTDIVGDATAMELVKNWQDEAQEILDRFDRENDCHTMTVKEWKSVFNDELKETTDDDERGAIKATVALLEDLEDNDLAINYVASDPIDFVVLPYGATTRAEQKLCQDLAIN